MLVTLALATCALAVAPAVATPPAPLPHHDSSVTVDFSMAEAMVAWLEAAKRGDDEAALRQRFFDRVAPTAGCQAIVRHWARFREWNAEIFYRFVLEALGRVPTDAPLVDEKGAPTRLGYARALWTRALGDPAAVRRDLEALRAADVRDAALDRARRFLPPGADASNAFSIVLFGASTAFSVGDANGFDLLQLPRGADGAVDVDQTIARFAHEIHHSGFSHASEATMGAAADDRRFALPGTLVAEGTATYYLTCPARRLDALRASGSALEREVAADWTRHTARLPELYAAAAQAIALGLDGRLPNQDIMRDWLSGATGAAYVLGADMVRTIDEQLGREEVFALVDYRQLLAVYNRAARKANAAGGHAFVFDDALAARLAGARPETGSAPAPTPHSVEA